MIACNTSNQWQECLQVYTRLVQSSLTPNTTTYNALISAYTKGGRLEKVMEVFQVTKRYLLWNGLQNHRRHSFTPYPMDDLRSSMMDEVWDKETIHGLSIS